MKKLLLFLLSAGSLLAQDAEIQEATLVELPIQSVDEVQFVASRPDWLTVLTLEGRIDFTRDAQGVVSQPTITPYTDRLENPTKAVAVHKGVRDDLFLFLENGELWWSRDREVIEWEFIQDLYVEPTDVQMFWDSYGDVWFALLSARGLELWRSEYERGIRITSDANFLGKFIFSAAGESGIIYQSNDGSSNTIVSVTEGGFRKWTLDFDEESIFVNQYQEELVVWTLVEGYWTGYQLFSRSGAMRILKTEVLSNFELRNYFKAEDSLFLGFYNPEDDHSSIFSVADSSLNLMDQITPIQHNSGFYDSPTVFTHFVTIGDELGLQKVFNEESGELTLKTESLGLPIEQILNGGVFIGSDEIAIVLNDQGSYIFVFPLSERKVQIDDGALLNEIDFIVWPNWESFFLEDQTNGMVYIGLE